jgi:hypothetical protein
MVIIFGCNTIYDAPHEAILNSPNVTSSHSKAWSGRDADHSPHIVLKSRMCRSYIFSPPCRLHGGRGIVLLSKKYDRKENWFGDHTGWIYEDNII